MTVLEHTGRRSLRIDAGDVVSVLGAPGSGKTKLALELAFLARPEEGEVLFHGVNPAARKSRLETPKRPREVTLLVQNAEDQLFARSVFDDVAFGPRHLLLPDEQITQRVNSALTAVGLDPDEICDRSPFALSGGERRRVALAGVLAMEPEVLILDEPTANLDPKTRNEFLSLLEPLRGRSAILWFTSRAREAQLTDRIYLLRNGATSELAAPSELFQNWRELASAGVELPTVYDLASALEVRGAHLPPTDDPAALRDAIVQMWRDTHDR